MSDIETIAKQMVEKPRGILAMDESTGTAGKRLESVGKENTEENRRAYREMLVTTENLGEFVSGAIMFEETLFQETKEGKPFVDCLKERNIIPGIKIDQGLEGDGEKVTKGLDGLPERLQKYYAQGARFTKWRAVIMISDEYPSDANIAESAKRLAQMAKDSQDAGMVPIVEPEVLMDGNHSLERCKEVTLKTQEATFAALKELGVNLKGMVLKPNMIVPGKEAEKASPEDVAAATVEVLKAHVPADVPGIAFLSGGIGDEDVTLYLNAMNKLEAPWNLTFSFGRGLQRPALAAFAEGDVAKGQAALLERSKASSQATTGSYAQ
ncbi:MAG: fructose-bisphosphate aldolase class I [Candidatus Woesearchaeota archaeon]|nr:fructose-bisphosphate aldolase class I [Candidatus Woesearchaeota archaeon]